MNWACVLEDSSKPAVRQSRLREESTPRLAETGNTVIYVLLVNRILVTHSNAWLQRSREAYAKER